MTMYWREARHTCHKSQARRSRDFGRADHTVNTDQQLPLTTRMMLVLVALVIIWAQGNDAAGLRLSIHQSVNLSNRPSCDEEHLTCCSGKVYYPPREMCCVPGWGQPGQIRYDPTGSSQCCGNKTYDTRRQLCCDGVMIEKSSVTLTSCCGTVSYVLSDWTCCETKLFPKSSSVGKACCGNKMFSLGRSICCDGVLRPYTAYTRCCHSNAYNIHQFICCRGALHRKSTQRDECCGRELCRAKSSGLLS
ncbi:hypothetical protein LSAT2_000869 [Lamellibrachia satsuma]|nr:hypothetical protein LSAT2_000869 [Lamellibrachia satsuma]